MRVGEFLGVAHNDAWLLDLEARDNPATQQHHEGLACVHRPAGRPLGFKENLHGNRRVVHDQPSKECGQ